MHIESVPSDALLRVFTFIPFRDIINNVSVVSQLFNEIASHSSLWKFLIKQDFHVDLKHIQEPLSWQKEYATLREQWHSISYCEEMRCDPECSSDLSLSFDNGEVTITGKAVSPDKITVVQATHPLMPLPLGDYSVGYFEAQMLHVGGSEPIGIGLARAGYYNLMPGWRPGSLGFHADDGRYFVSLDYGRDLSTPWKQGDICGCGVDFRRNTVFFTKNGNLLATKPCPSILLGIYVTIGFRVEGEVLRVNFGSKPFAFDVVEYQQSVRAVDPNRDLTVPYSTLVSVFAKRGPPTRDDPYEDSAYDDMYLSTDLDLNALSSMVYLLTEFPDDSASYKEKVARLLPQMRAAEDFEDATDDDPRQALVKFSYRKKCLRLLRLINTPARLNMLDKFFDHYSCQIVKFLVALNRTMYPKDHPMEQYAYSVIHDLGIVTQDHTTTNLRLLTFELLEKMDRHLLLQKSTRHQALKQLKCFDPSYYYYNVVENMHEDIDNPTNSYGDILEPFPFTTRQIEVLEHIVDCMLNKELTDEDPRVVAAIAQYYFEFRQSMAQDVDVQAERENLKILLVGLLAQGKFRI